MENLSKSNLAIIAAHEKGYKVINGILYNPSGKQLKIYILKSAHAKYYRALFSVLVEGYSARLSVARLVAYQKFGNEIFKQGIMIRHKDGNSLNNLDDNILIGTQSQNHLDKPLKQRTREAIRRSGARRVLTDKQVKEMREKFYSKEYSYKELMKMYNIKSSGNFYCILRTNYMTTK